MQGHWLVPSVWRTANIYTYIYIIVSYNDIFRIDLNIYDDHSIFHCTNMIKPNKHETYPPPRNLTWKLRISPWKRKVILETIMLRFHVKFRGGGGVLPTFPHFLDLNARNFVIKGCRAAALGSHWKYVDFTHLPWGKGFPPLTIEQSLMMNLLSRHMWHYNHLQPPSFFKEFKSEGDVYTRKILTKEAEYDFWAKKVKHDNIQKEYLLFPKQLPCTKSSRFGSDSTWNSAFWLTSILSRHDWPLLF